MLRRASCTIDGTWGKGNDCQMMSFDSFIKLTWPFSLRPMSPHPRMQIRTHHAWVPTIVVGGPASCASAPGMEGPSCFQTIMVCTEDSVFPCHVLMVSPGNRMMNSLGNIFVTPLAGIVFPCFATGTVLYLTGTAENVFGEAAKKLVPRVSAYTSIYVTGFSFVENAMPMREAPDTVEISPYCPPICYLSEETPPEAPYEDIELTLVKTRVHNDTLATFTFKAARPVQVRPSQNAVVDLSHFIRHRAGGLVDYTPDTWAESDDCVRTWTVSVPPSSSAPTTFALTIRSIPHGLVTPVLHQLAHRVDPVRNGSSVDVSALGIIAQLRGVGGSLPIPEPVAACDGGRRLLWIAGGIGLTPFLGLTRHVAGLARRGYGIWDVVLVVSAREPEVMLGLVREAYEGLEEGGAPEGGDTHAPIHLTLSIHLFTDRVPAQVPHMPDGVLVMLHHGRIDAEGVFFERVGARDREPHICGPLPFVVNAMRGLEAAGVNPENVLRERFTY